MDKIKVALIGHGHLGKWHAQKVEGSDLSQLHTIVEANENVHKELKSTYPDAQVVSSFEEISDDVQACIIATPTSFHFDIACKAVSKGLHVFCEKPLCDSFEKAISIKEQCLKAAKEHVFQVGHSERVHACWEDTELKKQLESANSIEITRVAPFKGRATDVSVIQDLMIHDIDLLLFQCRFKIINVRAVGKRVVSNNYDYVTVQFEGEDGRVAQITASRVDPVEKREIRICGPDGVTSIDLLNRSLGSFRHEKMQEPKNYEARDHLAIEQNYFYQSINDPKKNPIFCTVDEAISVQEIMEEIEEVLAGME